MSSESNSPAENPWFDELLASDPTDLHTSFDGGDFTDRVMATVPSGGLHRKRRRRILAVSTSLAMGLALLLLPSLLPAIAALGELLLPLAVAANGPRAALWAAMQLTPAVAAVGRFMLATAAVTTWTLVRE